MKIYCCVSERIVKIGLLDGVLKKNLAVYVLL